MLLLCMKLLMSSSVSLQPLSKETFYVVELSLIPLGYQNHSLQLNQKEDLAVLGALTELFNAAYLVWDDIMDSFRLGVINHAGTAERILGWLLSTMAVS